MKTHFLSWSAPVLETSVRWFLDPANGVVSDDGAIVDVSSVLVVTPGARAGRQWLRRVIDALAERDLGVLPPTIVTGARLADAVLEPSARPVARSIEWRDALVRAAQRDAGRLSALLPILPRDEHDRAWFDLAERLERTARTLIAGGVDMDAYAAVPGSDHAVRRAVRDVWHAAAALIDDCGLIAADHAWSDAIERRAVQPTVRRIVLVGVTELPAWAQRALHAATDAGVTIDALVHAPESEAAAFDALGLVRRDARVTAALPVTPAQLHVVDDPAAAAQCAVHCLSAHGTALRADEMIFGVLDPACGGALERTGARDGIAIHRPDHRTVSTSAPARALRALVTWLRERSPDALAAALRHPSIERVIATEPDDARGGTLARLDRWRKDEWRPTVRFGKTSLDRARDRLDQLVQPLHGDVARSIGAWSEPMLAVLATLCADDDDPATLDACFAIRGVLDEESEVPAALAVAVDGATAIERVLERLATLTLPTPGAPDALEALGWHEVPHDDAAHLILIGANESMLPERVAPDPLLPERVRRALGLPDQDARDARDRVALHAALHARQRVDVIVLQRTERGDPLLPSRLFFEGDDAELLARVEQLFADAPPPVEVARAAPDPPRFVRPPIVGVPPLERMRVTDFGAYLQCPYRYALQRRLQLDTIRPRDPELDPLAFGTLAHDVLEAFGRSDQRDETNATAIEAWLHEALQHLATTRFGAEPEPAIRIQIDRLRQRFTAFAGVQASLRRDGWRIHLVECDLAPKDAPEQAVTLEIPGGAPIVISGRIDRIDVHETEGTYRIIDYKTSAQPDGPLKAHHGFTSRKTFNETAPLPWTNLQLPLYAVLAPQRWPELEDVEVGYIMLPKSPAATAWDAGPWTGAHLVEAVTEAQRIVTAIRDEVFPFNASYRSADTSLDRICQIGVLGGDDDDPGDDA